MATDVSTDRLIPLNEAPDFLPTKKGKKINVSTLWRWATHGVRGSILETTKIAGTRYVTLDALNRFAGSTASPLNKRIGA